MSKLRNLPQTNTLNPNDLLYVVDTSVGSNGGRKITTADFKSAVSLTAAEIKALYESNADTNAFTDAEKSKLAGVEAGATADQTSNEVPFNNSGTDLSATEVESAIKQVNTKAQADFRPSIVSGRILSYSGGTVRFDGTFYQVLANDILLDQNITNGEVYVDLDGVVKQTGSGVLAPPYTVVFARFSTNLTDIIALTDERVKNAQNIVRGLLADVRDVRAGAAASEGNSGRVSDAMHKHNVLTAAPIAQAPNQANAEGNSIELARANHVHQIPTAAPATTLAPSSTNAEGAGVAFAKDTHTHEIAVGADADVSTITPNASPATGAIDKFARAGHTHGIATAAPSAVLAPSSANTEGTGNNFARATHVHQFAIALDADVSTILPNDTAATGAVDKFAKAAHKHAISTAAPVTTLAPSSTNTEGAGNSFARSTHTHAIAVGVDADVSTIIPNATPATGALDKFAKAGHTHGIATAAATSISTSTTNAEGTGNNFARATHTHAVSVSNQEATATADDTTTSATDVLMGSMTQTPAAGTYLVMWSGSVVNSANGAERTWVSLYLGGSQVAATERSIGTSGGGYNPSNTHAIITANGSQAIELRWRVAGGTSTVRSRRLTLVKLS